VCRVYDVAVVGDLNVDVILSGVPDLPTAGTSAIAADYAFALGGSAANAACGAARLGLVTCIVGKVGDDYFGRYTMAAAQNAGVDTKWVVISPTDRTGLTVSISGNDRCFLSYRGAVETLSEADITREPLRQARLVHAGGYHASRALRPSLPAILADVRKHGALVSVDVDWDPDHKWADLQHALPYVDILFVNSSELRQLTGHITPERGLEALAASVPLVVAKLGPAGAMALDDTGRLYSSPPLEAHILDTTGAGDSFTAAFLYAHLHGMGVDNALLYGNAAGALAVGMLGLGSNAPTLAQVEALLR